MLAVRRQVRCDARLGALAESSWQSVQTPRGGGPVGRPWQAVRQLDWHWPSFGVLQDGRGTSPNLISMLAGSLARALRASQDRLGRVPDCSQWPAPGSRRWLALGGPCPTQRMRAP